MSVSKFLLTTLCIAALAGCVSGPKRTALNNQTASSIKTAEHYNLVIQDEVRPAVNISNVTGAMGGGLIPALIDSSINKTRTNDAQALMEAFYFNTEDFDFRATWSEKITPALAQSLPIQPIKKSAEAILIDDKTLKSKVSKLNDGEALAYTSTFYSFVDDSKSLVVESVVFVFTKSKKANEKKPTPTFFNRYVAISPTYGNGGSQSIKMWTDDNSKLYRETISTLAADLASLIADDIKAQKDRYCGKPVKAKLAFMGGRNQTKATQISDLNQTIRIQDASGALYSIPVNDVSADPKTKPAKCN